MCYIGKCSISAAINHVQQLSPVLRELGEQQLPSRWGIDYESIAREECVVVCVVVVKKKRTFSIIKVKT